VRGRLLSGGREKKRNEQSEISFFVRGACRCVSGARSCGGSALRLFAHEATRTFTLAGFCGLVSVGRPRVGKDRKRPDSRAPASGTPKIKCR